MTQRWCLLIFALSALAGGCQKANPSAASSVAPTGSAATAGTPDGAGAPESPTPSGPTNAQPRLQTMKLFIGTEVVTAEVALTHKQVSTGMMFRKSMPENEGMLFIFSRPHQTAFYMKNTIVPLTAAYLDSEGTILELHDLQPLNESSVSAATDKVQFVLEMNQGWFKRHNVGVGAVIACEAGRIRDAFRLPPPQ